MIGGNGSGIPVYRKLQRQGIPFVTGVLHTNDADYQVAKELAAKVITEKPFECISESAFEEALEFLGKCEKVYCPLKDFGIMNEKNRELLKKAKETGTLLEVNNSSLRPEGFRENTKENCLEMVKECKAQGVMIVLGSDSHVDADIAEYPYAEEILKKANFPEELIANLSLEKIESLYKNMAKSYRFYEFSVLKM